MTWELLSWSWPMPTLRMVQFSDPIYTGPSIIQRKAANSGNEACGLWVRLSGALPVRLLVVLSWVSSWTLWPSVYCLIGWLWGINEVVHVNILSMVLQQITPWSELVCPIHKACRKGMQEERQQLIYLLFLFSLMETTYYRYYRKKGGAEMSSVFTRIWHGRSLWAPPFAGAVRCLTSHSAKLPFLFSIISTLLAFTLILSPSCMLLSTWFTFNFSSHFF